MELDMRQKLAQFGIHTTGHIVTAGVVVFLIFAWLLTGPLVQLSDKFAAAGKLKKQTNRN
ncbi:MAG TPA: hypothetical protein VK810_06705 [Dongiaceae bacterium]|nr:hypothetical protein [Dongiaceae bacterium]